MNKKFFSFSYFILVFCCILYSKCLFSSDIQSELGIIDRQFFSLLHGLFNVSKEKSDTASRILSFTLITGVGVFTLYKILGKKQIESRGDMGQYGNLVENYQKLIENASEKFETEMSKATNEMNLTREELKELTEKEKKARDENNAKIIANIELKHENRIVEIFFNLAKIEVSY